jgi:hypothetical protein
MTSFTSFREGKYLIKNYFTSQSRGTLFTPERNRRAISSPVQIRRASYLLTIEGLVLCREKSDVYDQVASFMGRA